MTRPTLTSVALVTCGLLLASVGGAAAGTLVTGADVKNGSLTGADVKDRSLGTPDLSTGAIAGLQRARAWARVAANGQVLAGSRGITVTRPAEGTYCLNVAGATRPVVAVATLDFTDSETVLVSNGDQSFVEIGNPQVECSSAAPEVVVLTFTRSYTGGGNTSMTTGDSGFYVVIP